MPRFRRTSQIDKTQPSLFFEPWADNSLIREESSDYPKVLYHGTTHDFNAFDPNNPFLNPESYWGSGFYFSDNHDDVNANYATTDSPDVKGKIDTLVERMLADDDWDNNDFSAYQQLHPDFFDANGKVTQPYDLAEVIAREKLLGHAPRTMPVYLKMKKPLNTTQERPTYFELNLSAEDDDDNGEFNGEMSGNFLELQQAIIDTASRYGLDGEEFWEDIKPVLEIKALDGFLTADEVFQVLIRQDTLHDIGTDAEGNYLGREFIKDVFRAMDYDGVIMDAWQHFGERGMSGIDPSTKHYISWDPTNIKSAIGNNGLYDPSNPVITAMNKEKTVRFAAYLDANGRFAEADVMDSKLQRWAKDQSGVKAKADEISREFLGMYTIHSVSGSNPKATVVVYADDLSEIPSSVKKKMRTIAKPYDVRFDRSEDRDDDSNRLEEII